MEQQRHGSGSSASEDMDDDELRAVLDIRCCECCYLGVGVYDVGGWAFMVRARCNVRNMDTIDNSSYQRRQALPAIASAHVIIGIVMVANGTIGARLHVPFPVLNRSSFGFWLSYFSVISRVILSMFWFGVQTFTGSECVYQVIFSHSLSFMRCSHISCLARC